MQEGTLKKINKERNAKTMRNIQDGLPFTMRTSRNRPRIPKYWKL